jgi:hypothetical protein
MATKSKKLGKIDKKETEKEIDLKLFNKAVADSKASYTVEAVKKELGL